MWEFSLSVSADKCQVAKYIYNSVKSLSSDLNPIITSYEHNGMVSVIFACDNFFKAKLKFFIMNSVVFSICTFFKEEYLTKKLKTPNKSSIENYTFKKALVNFDRETDRFIIGKQLILEQNLNLDSFFHFKLKNLKEKWDELVNIANDNSTYFLAEDSFLELLKFLIDNIEYETAEVNVVCNNGQLFLFDSNFEIIDDKLSFNCYDLVDNLLKLSPRKINWYTEKSLGFLEKVFEKRSTFLKKDENLKNIVDKYLKML